MKLASFLDVWEIVKKNLKNLLRSKASSLVIIIGPLLIIFLAGLAFDTSQAYSVKVGVYRPVTSSLTDEFLEHARERFKVVEYDEEDRCVSAIKKSEIHTCMVFPENFEPSNPPNNEVNFYVDFSRINLVWTVMKVMTEEVSDTSIQASRNLTRTLLETIEFTGRKVDEQREVLVKLTTENDVINRNAADVIAELGDADFSVEAVSTADLSASKTQVKQWMDNALSLGERALQEARQFISHTDNLVKSSGASGAVRNDLIKQFAKSEDKIKALKSDLAKTKELTQTQFAEFDAAITSISSEIGKTQSRLNQADASRALSIRVLESVRALLDKSLINLLAVQNALNEIEERIDSVAVKDPAGIAEPIVTSVKPVVAEGTYLNYLFPSLVVIVIMFTALLMGPTLVLLEKHSPAAFRNYMTPVKEESYVLGNLITCLLILFVQMLIILATASVFFSSDIFMNVGNVVLLLILSSCVFSLLGMLIGYVFNTEETAMLASISIGSLMLLLSDVIIPIESMPGAIASLAKFNPFVIGADSLRRALLFDSSFVNLLPDFLSLLGYVVAFSLITAGIFVLTRRNAAVSLMKKLMPVVRAVRRRKPKSI